MEKKSLKKNALLNSLRLILRLIFPLITIPYVSRVLGVVNVGKYSFAYSIISYFIILAKLGIETFAIREGSKYRDNRDKFNLFASEVFSINILSTILSYIFLIICLIFIPKLLGYRLLIIILGIEILLTTIGCEWVYTIYEDYGYITLRTILFQIISLILLLTFVKNENDLIIYTIIMVVSATGSNILNIFNLHKYCDLKFIITKNTKKYMIPILILFASSVTTTIYVSSDVTILGILSDNYHVGIYSTSVKIYTAIKSILSSIIVVSIPRLSYLYGKKMFKEFSEIGSNILNTLLVISLPAMTGIISIAYQIIYIVAGREYIDGTLALQILGFALIFSLFGWFYSSCILIPAKREKDVLIATICAGLTNIILNIILIPFFKQNAAAFTTLLAEFLSFGICYIKSKKVVKINIDIKMLLTTVVGCFAIFIYCYIINKCLNLSLAILLLISIIGSAFIYLIIELLLKNKIIMSFLNSFINKIKQH